MTLQFDRQNVLREAKDYIVITLGLMLFAFGWTVFLLPYQIVTGGVAGVTSIIYFATGIPIATTYFIINAVLLLVALKILGIKFLIKTVYATFMLTFLLWLAQEFFIQPDGTMPKILGEGQDFMSLIIGCSMTGSALAIVFLSNGSTGGTDIVAAIVNKYYNITLGRVLICVDLLIISSSMMVFHDWRKIVFGLCTIVIENFMLDYVMNARRESVQFLIFSRKYMDIANAIGTQMDHGVTILDGHGWYTGNEVKVLCILAKKNESQAIFRLIKSIDPNAFVSQSSVIGVYGEGFDEMKVHTPPHKSLLNKIRKKGDNAADS